MTTSMRSMSCVDLFPQGAGSSGSSCWDGEIQCHLMVSLDYALPTIPPTHPTPAPSFFSFPPCNSLFESFHSALAWNCSRANAAPCRKLHCASFYCTEQAARTFAFAKLPVSWGVHSDSHQIVTSICWWGWGGPIIKCRWRSNNNIKDISNVLNPCVIPVWGSKCYAWTKNNGAN